VENLLRVPFYPQQGDGNCLPACAQMVLAYYGIVRSQGRLAAQLSVRPNIGTPASTIQRIQSRTISVEYGSATLPKLKTSTQNGLPIIAFIQAAELPRWRGQYFQHAVVIVGIKADAIYLLDPAGEAPPEAVSEGDFMLAWAEMENLCAIIRRN
ncbi:MAG: C39 family peptidase, partial [Caldilineaceae bacterium]|nr:C39 family peptidase [Caldilineaceae bacterium]